MTIIVQKGVALRGGTCVQPGRLEARIDGLEKGLPVFRLPKEAVVEIHEDGSMVGRALVLADLPVDAG